MIGGTEGERRRQHVDRALGQGGEGGRRRDVVNEVPIDVKEIPAVAEVGYDVLVPDLVDQRPSTRCQTLARAPDMVPLCAPSSNVTSPATTVRT